MVRRKHIQGLPADEDRLSERLHSILPGTDGFRVPAGYFEELPAKISGQLEPPSHPVHVSSWIPFARHRVAWSAGTLLTAAATILIVFVVLPGLNNKGQELATSLGKPGVNSAEFIDYVDEPAILDQMGAVNLVVSPEISKDAIVSYLVDHDVQYDLIKDQLKNENK